MRIATRVIVTDIEGTTTALEFVHHVLFPYARQALPDFLRDRQHLPEVAEALAQVEQENPQARTLAAQQQQLLRWMEEDRKITPLKTLQGLIWRQGYQQGDFCGHVYDDAYQQLKNWHQQGIGLYVFSSGSIAAQQLLFRYSIFGDMTPLFSGYFDTTLGPKRQASSYQQMAEKIACPPQQILFLSDTPEELDAAQQALWQVVGLARGDAMPLSSHTYVRHFLQVDVAGIG